jgi:hypothetical protein
MQTKYQKNIKNSKEEEEVEKHLMIKKKKQM